MSAPNKEETKATANTQQAAPQQEAQPVQAPAQQPQPVPTKAQQPEEAGKSAVVKAEKATERQLKRQERVWLTINSTENDSTAVMVGVNGYAYRIKRDKPCLVPVAVVEALKLASYDVPKVERLPNGMERTTFKHVNRFAFSVEPEGARKEAEDA
ncbi:MAG: hypothetical protein J6N67_00560 [Desulfovibrio sp.]|nr:hypothetical protein [Desulfovibrio sp.]